MKPANRLHHVQEYYFSKKLREVRGLIEQGRPIINMGIGSPDLMPSPEVTAAMTSVANQPGAHQYQSYQGIPEFRQAIADFYDQKYGVRVNPDKEVLPLMGSKEGIMHISMAFLNPGDEVLIPDPGYPTYTSVTNLVGAIPTYYNLTEENKWLPDLEALEKRNLEKVKIMWVNYPHMPTGAQANRKFYKRLIAFAKKKNILLVNDNPYSFILNSKPVSILSVEGAMDVALELNSLSKTFNLSGWRVGMVLGNHEHLNHILKVKSNMDSGMFYGIQKGAIKALHINPDWYETLNKTYGKRKDLIFEMADILGCSCERETSGMFVWAKLPESVSSAEVFVDTLLYDRNIFVAPGSVFGKNGKRFIRFSLCIAEEKINEAVQRVSGNKVSVI